MVGDHSDNVTYVRFVIAPGQIQKSVLFRELVNTRVWVLQDPPLSVQSTGIRGERF